MFCVLFFGEEFDQFQASPGDYLRRVSIEAARTQYVLLVDDVFEIEFDEGIHFS